MLKHTDRLNKAEPTLIVKYGNPSKRYLALDRKSVVLGRARGCDIELDAPDISLVHCVVTRGPDGLYIRDCGSRAGTKVNGHKVQEAKLSNGDMVLLGAFSFEVYLPWKTEPKDLDVAAQEAYREQVSRLEKSRERLTNLALAMRRRLHEERSHAYGVGTAVALETNTPIPNHHVNEKPSDVETLPNKPHQLREQAEQALVARQAELTDQLGALHNRLREYEQKLIEVERREQGLNVRQDEINRKEQEQEKCTRQIVEAQREFEARRDVAIRELIAYRDHLAQARRELDEHPARATQKKAAEDVTVTGPLPDELRRLELRRRELDHFARHLHRRALTHEHEHAQWKKALDEMQSLYTEACQYQRVGLQTLQEAKECLQRLRRGASDDGGVAATEF